MKNQLDLIVSLSALVIALVFAGVFWGTARKPVPPPAVAPVKVSPVALPAPNVPMTNGLVPTTTQGGGRGAKGGGPAGGGGGKGFGGARG